MSVLEFDVPWLSPTGFQPDAVLGNSAFEVLVEVKNLRQLRDTLFQVAMLAARTKEQRGILILEEPQISEARLEEEWKDLRTLFQPELMSRLALVMCRNGVPGKVFGEFQKKETGSVQAVVNHVLGRTAKTSKRPGEAFFEVLRVLLVRWFRKSYPIMLKQLSTDTGLSYPTIAEALERLEPHLRRHSDRRVELRSFPRDEWLKLVAQAEKVRSSEGYADRSGRPRSVEVMQQRLSKDDLERMGLQNAVAVGGVLGARHYEPGLDLIGAPRLDLVFHTEAWSQGSIQSLLRHLDPALHLAKRGEPWQVVIHRLYRPVSLFNPDDNPSRGSAWADEVECALDLHEMHLEPQAMEFIDRLIQKATAS